MFKAWIPLIICFAVVVAVIIITKSKSEKSTRGPAEKDGIRKGLLVAFLTDSWLFGWLYARNNSEYDYKDKKLK